ncbi:Kazal serine protease inhibitor PbraEPI2 [Phytophthora cinnamomi]|uniref:Kazal serine protease inhibitor PbraEPI2 n=1 Tax=Phytophthora cinnamomi TaxID=4785 RepID=UPI003559CD7A|nr:Kazal serine protease inhibitor PbraEPI2 [Phytophthora cinnamomi]
MTTCAIENKLLASSGLLDEPHFRRLIKFQTRRREALVGSELEIRTTVTQDFRSEASAGVWFSVYCMHIRRVGDTRVDAGDRWMLKKRYSELEAFRRLLLKRIADWESIVRREFTRKTTVDRHKAFAVVSNAMRRAISPSFPKKHMRPNKPDVVKERVVGLPNFVRKLLGVYTDLAVYKTNRQLQAGGFASSWAQLCTIFYELETFLEIPQPQKDAEIQRQSAVLALKDLDEFKIVVDEDAHDQLCSICLTEDPVTDEARSVVSLPCGHHFHEDCVIDWFSTSTTCPLCRRSSH